MQMSTRGSQRQRRELSQIVTTTSDHHMVITKSVISAIPDHQFQSAFLREQTEFMGGSSQDGGLTRRIEGEGEEEGAGGELGAGVRALRSLFLVLLFSLISRCELCGQGERPDGWIEKEKGGGCL